VLTESDETTIVQIRSDSICEAPTKRDLFSWRTRVVNTILGRRKHMKTARTADHHVIAHALPHLDHLIRAHLLRGGIRSQQPLGPKRRRLWSCSEHGVAALLLLRW
jgi:hypothetical protein